MKHASFKKLAALFMALIMLISAVPSLAFTAVGGARSVLTESRRRAALAELMDFSARVAEMRKKTAPRAAGLDLSDPYCTARIIVKAAGRLDFPGAVASVSGHNDWHVVQYADRDTAEAECIRFSNSSGVDYAVPDILMHADSEGQGGGFRSWGYDESNVSAREYNNWILSFYGNSINALPTVKVAVIDTGADLDHPFLQNRLLPGYDFSNDDSDPEDDHHHGTHVSGTVVDGTLSNVKIVPVKVLDDTGYGEAITVALGIEYSYLTGCHVANLSLGGECDGIIDGPEHCLMAEAINAAMDAGTVVCISSGNEGQDAYLHCPANVERALTIGAIDSEHHLAGFSNYGELVDVVAPGVMIISAYPGGKFTALSGTSMAAPHVSAVAAMVKSYYPAIGADEVNEIIKQNAVDIGIQNCGVGMVCAAGIWQYYPEPVLGDADMDGAVTAADALIIMRIALGLIEAQGPALTVSDVDLSGSVTANDALAVLRASLGLAPLPGQP